MLSSIGVRNYRTFVERFDLEIAPITILLGANSSGKSSITRLPPLLSQSLSERSSAPILWVSEFLDFGSFLENVHGHDREGTITFSISGAIDSPTTRTFQAPIWSPGEFVYEFDVAASFDDETQLRRLVLKIYGMDFDFTVPDGNFVSEIRLNSREFRDIGKNTSLYLSDGLFPTPYIYQNEPGKPLKFVDREVVGKELVRIIRKYCHPNTSDLKLLRLWMSPVIGPVGQTMDAIKVRARSIPSLFKNFDAISDVDKEKIWGLLVLQNLSYLLPALERAISGDLIEGSYLAPVRAAAQRYYRRRELAVDRVDPTGENLAMYLNSLRYNELEEINNDFEQFFGHRINVHRSEGHISLRIGSGGDYEDNLADVGFGFSQLVPVLAQVYATSRSKGSPRLRALGAVSTKSRSPIVCVEQPELHLHPAFQGNLGAYFVDVANKGRGNTRFRFVIETHSEPLVNRVATAVSKGEIAPNDVKIYLFERVPGENVSRVVAASIDENGRIPNWPFGFFSTGNISGKHSSYRE